MKILATVKRTPDRNSRMRLTPAGALLTEGVSFEMNAFDELAVEEALQIRDRIGGEVIVAAIGSTAAAEQLQTALAMGADRALRIDTADELEPLQIARALATAIAREAPDLVLMGKLAIDAENGQIPLMLAELLDWPHASFASKIEFDGSGTTARVTCEVDGGLEIVEVGLPAVITTDLRLNQPRYASLPGILKAKKKPSSVVSLAELLPSAPATYRVTAFRPLPLRTKGEILDSPEELAARLIAKGLV